MGSIRLGSNKDHGRTCSPVLDGALSRSLTGHFYLSGVTETGSELPLDARGL